MADFCGADDRLIGVAIVPLDDPELALAELDFAIAAGLKARLGAAPRRAATARPATWTSIPSGRGWRRAARPSCCTSAARPAARQGLDEQRPAPDQGLAGRRREPAHQGHRPAARGAGDLHLHAGASTACFERFPSLRGGSVELGAGWVPELLRRLDWVAKHWSRADKNLAAFSRKPSEQLTQQMAFTPFVFEEVGKLIDQSNPDLYLFSSDYPHIEGGRNPIGRFESGAGRARRGGARQAFYAENFLRIFPGARAGAERHAGCRRRLKPGPPA